MEEVLLLTRLCSVTVIPVLFQNTLHPRKENPDVTLNHIFGVEPVKITSPPTDSEVALALRVLEGCCLLHSGSAALAYKYKAVKVQLARCYMLNPECKC